MTEFLKDMARRGPDDPMPPVNLGPYDNPLLWNKLDPFGADRGHQRRPMSVSRDFMELNLVPLVYRDQCVHRWVPYNRCRRNLNPVTFATANCQEFLEAWTMCRAYESYRLELLKEKFVELTKDYTNEDKKFFPSTYYVTFPHYFPSFYWSMAASQRLSGWDERDPQNPMMDRQPNRALMRSEFTPTNWEEGLVTSAYGNKIISDRVIHEALPGFPLPEDKRPT